MSYVRSDSLMYQMSVHFGSCVTPQQNKEGKRFIYDQATRLTKHTIVYGSDSEALSAVLPQRFELAALYVIININMLRDVAWLAGHGYNLIDVSVPTRFHGEKEVVGDNLFLVMRENHTDPITISREQLGYSRIFASIDDIHTYGGVSKTELTSWGSRFLELELDANRQLENLEELKRALNNPDNQGIMHYKYIPRTGGDFTQADAEYVYLNPKAAKLPDGVKRHPADQLTYMGGQVRWHVPTWEDTSTQYHVAQALGSLPVKRIAGAARSEGCTLGDLYEQTTVMRGLRRSKSKENEGAYYHGRSDCMSPNVISLVGILLGMIILVFLALKGYNVITVSVIAALVVAVFTGTDILPLITDSYMTKFADLTKNNSMIFLLSIVSGKLMGDSGAADTITYSMLRVVNHVHSQRTKQLVGGLIITTIVAVLTYGGVSLFVIIFTLISIGRKLFEELDIPWWHYLTFHGIGSTTFTMTMLLGTAALQNIIPTQCLGTTSMAGAAISLTGAAIQILLCVLRAALIPKRARARGEDSRPSGGTVKTAYRDEDEKKTAAGGSQAGIPPLLALIPPVVLFLVLNVCKLHAVIALSCGILVYLILFGLILRRLDNLKATLVAGAVNSIFTIGTTCTVVGFGGVVAAVSGYQLVLGSLTSIPGPVIFKLIIAANVAADLTGSSSSGLSIALENMQDYFLGLGLPPNVIHRTGAVSSGGLDSMPHVNGFVSNFQVCRLDHRQSYPSYAMVCLVIPIVTTCACAVLLRLGTLSAV